MWWGFECKIFAICISTKVHSQDFANIPETSFALFRPARYNWETKVARVEVAKWDNISEHILQNSKAPAAMPALAAVTSADRSAALYRQT